MHFHYKVQCKDCEKVIRQCRCANPNKHVAYETCGQCKSSKK